MTRVRLRGLEGVEWEFDLPLTETYANQVRTRELLPADEESAAALADELAFVQPDDRVLAPRYRQLLKDGAIRPSGSL
jgi:hypothetical protein